MFEIFAFHKWSKYYSLSPLLLENDGVLFEGRYSFRSSVDAGAILLL